MAIMDHICRECSNEILPSYRAADIERIARKCRASIVIANTDPHILLNLRCPYMIRLHVFRLLDSWPLSLEDGNGKLIDISWRHNWSRHTGKA